MTLASVLGNLTGDILCKLYNFLRIFRTSCENSENCNGLLKLNKDLSLHMCSVETVCGSNFHVYGFSFLPSTWNLSTSEYEQTAFVALTLLRAIRCTRVGKGTLLIVPVNREQCLTCAAPCPPLSVWWSKLSADGGGVVPAGWGSCCYWWRNNIWRGVCPGLSPVQQKWSCWKESR